MDGTVLKNKEGFTFALYNHPDCTEEYLVATDTVSTDTGFCVFSLPRSQVQDGQTLYLKETAASDDYLPSPAIIEVPVDFDLYGTVDSEDLIVEVANIEKANSDAATSASIHLIKTVADSADDEVIPDVSFGLYDSPSCTNLLDTKSTQEDGTLTFEGLYPGTTYYVKELSAPDAYVVDDTVHRITASITASDAAPTPAEIFNEQAQAVIQIEKLDADNHDLKLAGAEFKLYTDAACTDQVGTAQVTDTSGLAYFTGLQPYTTYYPAESVAPDGYQRSTEPIAVTTKANSADTPVVQVVENTPEPAVDPVDPPVDPVDPPVDPVDPPVDPVDPPVDPVDPPVDPVDPPVDPVDPNLPNDPQVPEDPSDADDSTDQKDPNDLKDSTDANASAGSESSKASASSTIPKTGIRDKTLLFAAGLLLCFSLVIVFILGTRKKRNS